MATECQHRSNRDGTIDSLCPYCYTIIGNAHLESDLEPIEADHICEPQRLAHFKEDRRRGAKRKQRTDSRKVQPIRRVD